MTERISENYVEETGSQPLAAGLGLCDAEQLLTSAEQLKLAADIVRQRLAHVATAADLQQTID